jgi:AcrR family transcriptional regulator
LNALYRPTAEHPRAGARRAQILAAAADCFRSHGFHGASIASISAAAGMSAGHIYHYFENKEAIIAGIVAQDLDRALDITAQLRSSPDVLDAVLGAVAGGVDRSLNAEAAAFKVEIAAEASRNERVAAIVRAADEQGLASLVETLRSMRRARGHRDDDAALAGMAEVVAALFDGLTVRGIRNPGLDRDGVARLIRRIIASFADEPIDAAS